jgi:hypothetical protein
MKKLAILFLLLGLETASVVPAFAAGLAQETQTQKAIQSSSNKCFKVRKGSVVVPYNLTAKQQEFLTLARFASKEAMDNYIVINSIENTFQNCLKNSYDVPGFTYKRTGRFTFLYNSKFTNVTLVNGTNKEVIQGAVEVKVRYRYRKGGYDIQANRKA